MDDNILDGQLCSEYIYSEEYLNFLVRYNNDLQGVYERFNPACVTIINNRFLVAFRNISEGTFGNVFRYGYREVPKCYGLMDITGVVDTGADRVRILPGLNLTGRGTLIGFVDTGERVIIMSC